MMLYVILGLGILFVGIGYIVTEKNAKYLLSGYNTMSEEERALVDIKNYIPFFRKFHLYFGLSFTLIGAGIHHLYGETYSGVFLGLYPMIAYTYFIWKAQEYSKVPVRKWENFGIGLVILVFIGVGGLFFKGYQELEFSYTEDKLTIHGMYGEVINKSNIRFVSLVDSLPHIKHRKNGFSIGDIHKGYIRASDDSVVKLLLDSKQRPVIFIDLVDGSDIYFSYKTASNIALYEQLKQTMSSVTFVN